MKRIQKTGSKHRWLAPICLALLLSSSVPLSNATSHSRATNDGALFVSTATRAGRLVVFDDVWETIQERYYDPTFRGVDWEASRRFFRPAAAEAKSSQEFYELLRRMIAPLKDAHTRVYSPEEKFDWWSPRFITIGIVVREVAGVLTVVHVDAKSPAANAGVHRGDIITNIDDVPSSQLIARRTTESDSSSSIRTRVVRGLFEGTAGTKVLVKWQTKNGKQKSASLERYWTQRVLGFRSREHDGVLILTLDAFTRNIATEFLKQLPRLTNGARGIIIDLRGNGGGDAEAMADVASAFFETGVNLGKFADRSGDSFELFTNPIRRDSFVVAAQIPIVVLTGEATSSAAEILAAALQTRGRARVIGNATCGCVLAIRNRHSLPDGGVLDVSEFDYRTAEGIRLEGAGVNPDETVTVTRSDLYAERDPALDLAKKYLRSHKD